MACRAARVVGIGFLAAAAVLAVGSLTQCIGRPSPDSDSLPIVFVGGKVTLAHWRTYEDEQHGFAIGYPGGFVPEVPGDPLVASGAVVTFVPTFDASIDEAGTRTNLYEVSVTIAVVGAGEHSLPEFPCLIGADSARLPEIRVVRGRTFSKYCFSDAGAGNVYEEIGYRTTRGLPCYEIVLFLHSGNPAFFYPEGTIAVFDSAPFLEMLGAMVATFRLLPPDVNRCG